MVKKLPTEFNDARQAEFLRLVQRGVGMKHAAGMVGVSVQCLSKWIARGRKPDGPRKYKTFVRRYERARLASLGRLEEKLHDLTEDEDSNIKLRAITWTLERRSKRWAPKRKEEPKPEQSGPALTPEAEQALAEWMMVRNEPEVQALLAKRRGEP